MSDSNIHNSILKAIEIIGSEAKLARAAGVSQPVLNVAKQSGKVGPKLALGIHRATGGAVSRSDLCPEYYPPEMEVAPAGNSLPFLRGA